MSDLKQYIAAGVSQVETKDIIAFVRDWLKPLTRQQRNYLVLVLRKLLVKISIY